MTAPPDELRRYFDILELRPDAGPAEVKNAYIRLKKLYAADSPFRVVLERDFPEEKRLKILEEVEEAYRKLAEAFRGLPQAPAAETPPSPDDTAAIPDSAASRRTMFTGRHLKRVREMTGLSLQELYKSTKIRAEILQYIEDERFDALPDEAFLRTHLAAYAVQLGLDPKAVVADYVERFKEWRRFKSWKAED